MITTKPQALLRLRAILSDNAVISVDELDRLLTILFDEHLADVYQRLEDLEANDEVVELNFDEENEA